MRVPLGLLALLGLVTSSPAAPPAHQAELVFPLHPKHNHAPGIVECPNGDLLASWYADSEQLFTGFHIQEADLRNPPADGERLAVRGKGKIRHAVGRVELPQFLRGLGIAEVDGVERPVGKRFAVGREGDGRDAGAGGSVDAV